MTPTRAALYPIDTAMREICIWKRRAGGLSSFVPNAGAAIDEGRREIFPDDRACFHPRKASLQFTAKLSRGRHPERVDVRERGEDSVRSQRNHHCFHDSLLNRGIEESPGKPADNVFGSFFAVECEVFAHLLRGIVVNGQVRKMTLQGMGVERIQFEGKERSGLANPFQNQAGESARAWPDFNHCVGGPQGQLMNHGSSQRTRTWADGADMRRLTKEGPEKLDPFHQVQFKAAEKASGAVLAFAPRLL